MEKETPSWRLEDSLSELNPDPDEWAPTEGAQHWNGVLASRVWLLGL